MMQIKKSQNTKLLLHKILKVNIFCKLITFLARQSQKKNPDISALVKKRDYNAKITEIEGKIPTISGLATNATLTAVENKIRNTNSFVRKTDYDTKITEIEKKFIDHDYDKSITTKYIIEAKAILKGWYAKLFWISTNVTIF